MSLSLSPATLTQMLREDDRPAASDQKRALWPIFAAALGDAGDILSTQRALSLGAHESNPLLPKGRVGNAIAQGAEAALAQYLLHRMGPNHPTLRKIFGASVGAVGAYSTMRNMQTIRTEEQRGR